MEGKEPILLGSLTLFHSLNFKAILDATHKARMSKRQHRTSAKIARVQEISLAHPYPKAALLGRLTQS